MANAAEDEGNLFKGSKISVKVEEALIDVIIVSFHYGNKIFQGALLDVTKKNVPFGISPWVPSGGPQGPHGETVPDKGDRFHALKQRHTYFQEKADEFLTRTWSKTRKATNRRDQSVRMRRLRPRQVLCSHCRAICNENSENVQLANLKKGPASSNPAIRHEPDAGRPVAVVSDTDAKMRDLSPPPEHSASETAYASVAEGFELKNAQLPTNACSEEFLPDNEYQALAQPAANRMILRKRKPSGGPPPQDLDRPPRAAPTKTSPVIKISFANPQGKGTVVKIPAKLQSTGTSDTEEGGPEGCARVARKALKKARREHHRTSLAKHHKHKRKRKHREPDVPRNDVENGPNRALPAGGAPRDEDKAPLATDAQPSEGELYLDEGKTHKLSISLRRLGSQAYMRYSPRENDDAGASSGSASGSECGDVPEFPKLDPVRDADRVKPLMMRISTHTVKRCTLETGREMVVGDIVWGKIHGFPWWPGKVLALTVSQRDNGVTINQQAHVAWFGSSTSSYMPCHQLTPFLDDFKVRYNRKKRGPYKEAIRQATLEAQQAGHRELPPEVAVGMA